MIINLSLDLTPVFHFFSATLIFLVVFQLCAAFMWSKQFFDFKGEKFTKKPIPEYDKTHPCYVIFFNSLFSFSFFLMFFNSATRREHSYLILPTLSFFAYFFFI